MSEKRQISFVVVLVVLLIGIAATWGGVTYNNTALLILGIIELLIGFAGVWAMNKLRGGRFKPSACPNCGEPLHPGSEQCPKCGINL